MPSNQPLVDLHCHLLPGMDDGARTKEEALDMARLCAEQGVEAVIVTPHQLGMYAHNTAERIRRRTVQMHQWLEQQEIPLQVLPGADVRIEPDLVKKLEQGDVLTLADQHKHVLLELPHELYFPLERVLDQLQAAGMVGILSHPERNQGLRRGRQTLERLVDAGCLMQVTSGSLLGSFGQPSRELAEWMLRRGLVHFIATDAHGCQARRPSLRNAFDEVSRLCGTEIARRLCWQNPAAVLAGEDIERGRPSAPGGGFASWFRWKVAS